MGLASDGTFRVSNVVLMWDPVVVYFSPTYLAISSVVLVYATPPFDSAMSYIKPLRSSDRPTNFSLGCGWGWP
jgi:hypothetical protein